MTTKQELEEIMEAKDIIEASEVLKQSLPNASKDEDFDAIRYAVLLTMKAAEQVYREYTRMQEINSKLEEEKANDNQPT